MMEVFGSRRRSCVMMMMMLSLCSVVAGLGGWREADVEDDRVRTVAGVAVDQFQGRTNSLFASRLIRIRKAETQIVSGVNYRLVLDIGYTNCRKSEVRQSSCPIQQKQSCTFVVWDRPWLNEVQLTGIDCGSIETVELSSGAEDAAVFAVSHLQTYANGMYLMHFRRILKAEQELSGVGTKYKLEVECLVDSCKSSKRLSDCKSQLRNETVLCSVDVRVQLLKKPTYFLERYRCTNKLSAESEEKNIQVISQLKAFEDFKVRYKKQYGSMSEENLRFDAFQKNLNTIKFLEDHELGTARYGVTQFADLTPEEFRTHYLTPYWNQREDRRLAQAHIPAVSIPAEFDWRHYNAVTPVKNQGSCGSCWAFSVTGNIEGQWAIQKKNLISLSEQELVDCDKLDEGCNGGLPASAYQEIQRLVALGELEQEEEEGCDLNMDKGGLESETDYPYEGKDDSCHLVKQDIRVYINGSLNISKNENDMAAWIYKNGPVSIGINAFAMQFYFGGISHPWKIFCSPDDLDHGVLIVGYGIKKGLFGDTPYWIVKNSWGSYWGEQGYYLVYRGDGTCGLNQMVSSAVVK